MIKICLIEAETIEEALSCLGMEALHDTGPDFAVARFKDPSAAVAFGERLRQAYPKLTFTRWGGEFRLEALPRLNADACRKDRT